MTKKSEFNVFRLDIDLTMTVLELSLTCKSSMGSNGIKSVYQSLSKMAIRIENLTIFSQAVRTGSTTEFIEIEKWLERHEEDPGHLKELARRPNGRGETPLMLASKLNHLDVVKYLVERYEVDVDQPANMWWDSEGNEQSKATALHAAVILGHEELVHYLVVDCKANVNAKTDTNMISPSPGDGGNTPLHFATLCLDGRVQENIIRCLVQNGANLSDYNNAGNPCWALTSDVDGVKLLIELGIDTNKATSKSLETLAHIWASASLDFRSTEVLQLLVEKGANIHLKDYEGSTPIMLAAIGTDGVPNLDVFRFIFDQESQPLSRLEKIEALELLAATYVNNITFELDLAMFYWRKAFNMRFNMPDEPPLPVPIMEMSECARKATRGVQEATNIQQLENMAIFNPDALRVQAILTYFRILGSSNSNTWNIIDKYAVDSWNWYENENFINYSMLVLECTQALNEALLHQTINAMHQLVIAFYALVKKNSPPEHRKLVNFSSVMAALYRVAKELELAIEDLFWNEEEDFESRDFLLIYVVQLAALISSMKLTDDESFEFKRCLFQIVRQGKRSSRDGRCLLLLACTKYYDYTLEIDNSEIRDDSEDLRLGLHPNAELIRHLIEVGANPDSGDTIGNTGLHILAQLGEKIDSPTIRALLEGGAHVDHTNISGETMMDILFKGVPREENTILVCPMRFPLLKCLSARVVRRNFFPGFDLQISGLNEFVMQH